MRSRHIVGIVLAATVLSTPSSAGASARAHLEEFFRQATVIASNATNTEAARDDMLMLAQGLFDGRRAARQALGAEWDRRSDAEREEFTRVFTGSFERACVETMQALLPRDRPIIRILGEDAAEGNVVVVRTEIRARNGDDVRFDYRMVRADERWRVHDVVIDGVSLVENYRAQFARILRTSSYAALVGRLRVVSRSGAGEAIVASPPVPAPEAVVAHFDASRAELSPAARRDLEKTAAWLAANGQARVLVEGHADQRGDPRSNQVLAERRATAIRERLVVLGVDRERVAVVTYGDRQPLCRQAVETCWAQNRRAVVRLTP